MKVIGYTRVSTEVQATGGASLEEQRDRVRAYVDYADGLELVELVEDAGVSAGTPLRRRPGGAHVAELVDAGDVDAVVVYSLDRLFRNLRDALDVVDAWTAAGVALYVVNMNGTAVDTSSAAGRFVFQMLAGADEMQRNAVRERVRDALAHLRAQGVRLGRAPYGYRHGDEIDDHGRRVLLPVAAELEVVALAVGLRAEGHSLREIAASLRDGGYETQRGGDWYASTIRNLLRRAAAP